MRSCCDPVPVEAASTGSASCPTSGRPHRPRRPRRVMYPASQSRRPRHREAPDPANRWLLLLSLLVVLQICSEDTHTCSELQSQCSDPATRCPQEADGSLAETNRFSGQESRRRRAADRAPDHQLQCVAA